MPLCQKSQFGTHLKPMVACSLTIHLAVNGNPAETLGRLRRQGKELATLPDKTNGLGQVSSLTGTSQMYRSYMGIYLYLLLNIYSVFFQMKAREVQSEIEQNDFLSRIESLNGQKDGMNKQMIFYMFENLLREMYLRLKIKEYSKYRYK